MEFLITGGTEMKCEMKKEKKYVRITNDEKVVIK